MGGVEELVIRFVGVNLMSNVLHGIGNDMDSMASKGSGALSKLHGGLTSVASAAGSAAMMYGTAFIVMAAAAGYAIKQAATFDSTMMYLHTHGNFYASADAKTTATAITDLGNGFLAMAGKVGFTANELAQASYWITSVGYGTDKTKTVLQNTNDILTIQSAAAKTAAMAQADLGQTTRTLAIIMNSYGASASDATKYAGLLNAAVGTGSITMDEMNAAFRTGLIPTAVNAGVKFDQLGAALDVLTAAGYRGATGATAVRNSIIYMQTGSAKATADLKTLGLTHAQLIAEMSGPGGLAGALDLISQKLVGLPKAQQLQIIADIFGRTRGMAGAQQILEHLGLLNKDLAAVDAGANNFATHWQQYTTTAGYQTRSVADSVNALSIMFGQALEPAFKDILAVIGPYLAQAAIWISQNHELFAHIVLVALAVTGFGAALTGTIAIITMVASVILSGPGLAFIALTGIIYLVVTHFDELKQHAAGVAQWFMTTLHPIFEEFGKIVQRVADWIKTKFIPKWDELLAAGKRFVDWAQGNLIHFFQDVANFIQQHVLPRLMDFANWFTSTIMPAIAVMVDAFRTSVIPAVENVVKAFMAFSGWMLDHVIPVFEWIIFNVGGTVINILEFLAQHIWIVEAAVGALVARFVILKGIEFAGWILGIVSNMTQMVGSFAATVAASGAVDESNKKVVGGLGLAMNAWRGLPESTSLWRAVSPSITQGMDVLAAGVDGTSRGIGNLTGSINVLTTPLQDAAKLTWNWVTREEELAAALDKVGGYTQAWEAKLGTLITTLEAVDTALGSMMTSLEGLNAVMTQTDGQDAAMMTGLVEMSNSLTTDIVAVSGLRDQLALNLPVIIQNTSELALLDEQMAAMGGELGLVDAGLLAHRDALEQDTLALMNALLGERDLAAGTSIGTGAMDLQAKAALGLGAALDKTAAQAVIDGRLMATAMNGGALVGPAGGAAMAAAGAGRAAMPANVGNGLAAAATEASAAEAGVVAETGLLASAGAEVSSIFGVMTSGFGLAALAVVGLATNMGGLRDGIKNALFGSGNLGDFNSMLTQTNQSATQLGDNIANNVTGDIDALAKKAQDAQGFFGGLEGFMVHASSAGDSFKATFANTMDSAGRSIQTTLMGMGATDTYQKVSDAANNFSISWGAALKYVAGQGDETAQSVYNAWMKSEAGIAAAAGKTTLAQNTANANDVKSALEATASIAGNYATTIGGAHDAVAAAQDRLTNASSDKEKRAAEQQLQHAKNYVDFLNQTTDPALKTQASDLQKIADKYGITVQELMQGGSQTVITYQGIHDTIANVLLQLQQNAWQTNLNKQLADGVANGWLVVANNISQATRNAQALANASKPGRGMGITSATGRFVRGGSNLVTSVAEDEDEWIIPRSKAGPHAGLLDAMLNGGSLGNAQQAGGGGSVNVAVAAPSGGGMTASQAQGIADGINELVAIAQRQESSGNGAPSGSPGPAVGISSALFNVVSQATRDRNRGIRGGFGTH